MSRPEQTEIKKVFTHVLKVMTHPERNKPRNKTSCPENTNQSLIADAGLFVTVMYADWSSVCDRATLQNSCHVFCACRASLFFCLSDHFFFREQIGHILRAAVCGKIGMDMMEGRRGPTDCTCQKAFPQYDNTFGASLALHQTLHLYLPTTRFPRALLFPPHLPHPSCTCTVVKLVEMPPTCPRQA